ncbi:MAG: hypothetical protein WDN26_19130 [Chitinophagaceae bacterium]
MISTNFRMIFSYSTRRFNYLVALVLLSINSIAQTPQLSIITDAQPGMVVSQGLDKLIKSLEAKHITFEQVTSAQNAKGRQLLITGLAYGNGGGSISTKGK